MFDYGKIAKDFGLDIQTSEDILNSIQEWAKIYNKNEPWVESTKRSLHVAKTISEKVAASVVNEFKSTCSDDNINPLYQKVLKNIQKDTEYLVGKGLVYFKPYYDGKTIRTNIIQADKFIPVKFDDSGNLTACITIDQITKGKDVYTRLEYSELTDDKMIIKNIAYEGKENGTILNRKINLNTIDKWKDIEEETTIEGIDRLLGGFVTMPEVNSLDNDSPIGPPIWYNALDTLKSIDEQYARTLWEYEGSELAIDIDESVINKDKNGNPILPKGKERLFRKVLDVDDTKDKSYNVFSPEIRYNAMFDGLNELLRIAEEQCHLEHGTLCKAEVSPKTAEEIKQMKQTFYTTISNIQTALKNGLEDLVYSIYVLCRLYGIPVGNDYSMEFDFDDSIIVDKDNARKQSLLELNNSIISQVQYVIETRNMKEQDAIEFVKKQQEYAKLTEKKEEPEPDEE